MLDCSANRVGRLTRSKFQARTKTVLVDSYTENNGTANYQVYTNRKDYSSYVYEAFFMKKGCRNYTPELFSLLPQSQKKGLVSLNFLLELEQTKQECLSSGWASRNINIYWNNSVTSSNHRVRVMVITTSIGTRSHGNDPAGLRHLIVNLAKRRGHFIGKGTSHDHDIRLTRRRTEHHAKTLHIVSRRSSVHHFDSTACQTKRHGPQRAFTCPIHEFIYLRNSVFDIVLYRHLIQPARTEIFYTIQATQLETEKAKQGETSKSER